MYRMWFIAKPIPVLNYDDTKESLDSEDSDNSIKLLENSPVRTAHEKRTRLAVP